MDAELYRRMLPVFLDEAEAKLRDIDRAVAALGDAAPDPDARGRLARAVHTIRGNAAMLGLAALVDAAAAIEAHWPLADRAAPPARDDLARLCTARARLRVLLDEVAGDLMSLSAL